MTLRFPIALMALFSLAAAAVTQEEIPARTVIYHTTIDRVKCVYGVAPPSVRLGPGDVFDTNTLDAFGDAIQKPGDTHALVKRDNPLTGPIYIEGAEPGDTIAVEFLTLEVDSSQGIGAFAPGFGAISSKNYTPMLNAPIPERIYFYPIAATFQAQDPNSP